MNFRFAALMFIAVATVDGNGRGMGMGPPPPPKVDCIGLAEELNVNWRNIIVPHQLDCTKFLQCSDVGLVEMVCADRVNTRYDPSRNWCEWNCNVGCITFYPWLNSNETLKAILQKL